MARSSTTPTQRNGVAKQGVEEVIIGPEEAQEIIDRGVTDPALNRKVSPALVDRYAHDMAAGNWIEDTGQTIKLDAHGRCLDGQHRLRAVVKSGCKIRFDVKYGVKKRAQLVIDTNRKRTFADHLGMRGVHNATSVGATANLLMRWQNQAIFDRHSAPTHVELDVFTDEHSERLADAVREAQRVCASVPTATRSVIATAWFEASVVDEGDCLEFFEALISGENLEAGNPIKTLRDTIIRYGRGAKPRQEYQLYQVIHCWNAWRGNKTISLIKFPRTLTTENFPRMR